jgi:anaerobic selenocysteine-containing dehydrogenase
LFLFRRLVEELLGSSSAISVSWRVQPKQQPESTKFKVPAVDAPNVSGARMFGLAPGSPGDPVSEADLSRLRSAVEAGTVAALYVFDPGPDGSLGLTDWIVEARRSGKLPLLVYHGVLDTALARASDVVLPGASYVEKEASYSNDQGRLQTTARAIPPPGEAMEDWEIVVNLATALGAPIQYATAAHIRADIAGRFGEVAGLSGIANAAFGQLMRARNWLQASNPSERWKWDFMFQDLPPVKFDGEPFSTNFAGVIPLKEVK